MTLYDRFRKAQIKVHKSILHSRENVDLDEVTNVRKYDVCIMSDPYPHVVIPDFFKPTAYENLCSVFTEAMRGGLHDKRDYTLDGFHAFDIAYDGYTHSPQPTVDPRHPLSIFYSIEWNLFFSKLFNQCTTTETKVVFHYHPAGDKTGSVHHDHIERSPAISVPLSNGVIGYKPLTSISQSYTDLTRSSKQGAAPFQAIAILFYLLNDGWHEGDGGETGVYSADRATRLKVVPPINNTLFAFQTSLRSMHTFQTNRKNRHSIIQWLHAPAKLS